MGNESSDYVPLVPSDSEPVDNPNRYSVRRNRHKLSEKILFIIVLFETIALALALFAITRNGRPTIVYADRPLLYSPAQEILEYEVKVFTLGHEDSGTRTIYQDFTAKSDEAWGDLYLNTIFKLPKNQAALLPNKTYPIHYDQGYYLAGFDVFHQLHCLDVIRHAVYKEHYNDPNADADHVSHCIDAIRQSLMCSADTSVNVWQWSNNLSLVVGYSSQAHTCRNFDKLRDWVRDRQIDHWIDIRVFVEDELPYPPIIS